MGEYADMARDEEEAQLMDPSSVLTYPRWTRKDWVPISIDKFSFWLGITFGLLTGWALPHVLGWLLGAP